MGGHVFNPSFPYRLVHMVLAAYLSTAFIVGGTAAWQLLHRPTGEATRIMLSMAMWMAALVALLPGRRRRPARAQHVRAPAGEGRRDGGPLRHACGCTLVLFGWPDMEQERTRYAVEVPKLGSLILTHEWDGTVRGLKEWPPRNVPTRPSCSGVFA